MANSDCSCQESQTRWIQGKENCHVLRVWFEEIIRSLGENGLKKSKAKGWKRVGIQYRS